MIGHYRDIIYLYNDRVMAFKWSLRYATSHRITHPWTTPARARLTSQFYPTPAPPHLTATCWYIYHINPIKPCWCLGLCSCSWVWWNFEKYFKLSSHITYHFLKKNSKKREFETNFFSVTSGAPSKRCATSKFEFVFHFFPSRS